MKIAPHSKLVFIGDSITDCERARPVGEGLFGALGKGYVSLVEGLLYAIHPESAVRIVNMGTSGHTVLDLKARWQTDVIALKPDWLVVMIGVNDVWRQFDLPRQTEIHVSIRKAVVPPRIPPSRQTSGTWFLWKCSASAASSTG